MNRIFASVVAVMFLVACKTTEEPGSGGTGGGSATGGAGGSGTGGAGAAGTGGSTGSGGGSGGSGGSGAGGAGSGGSGSGGSGAGGSGTGGAAVDAAVDAPADIKADGPASDRPGILGEGADYPGRPEVRICNKEWTQEQCCEFLCRCLVEICSDAPKAKNGIGTCKTWCPKLSNMAMRCHVYHCFESVSMGGKKDHDSHCGHAADQVPGGMCRKDVYN